MHLEERNDRPHQICTPTNSVPVKSFAVIVSPSVREDLTRSEEVSEFVQGLHTSSALRHDELVSHLVAGSVALSALPALLPDETD
jgi:hypothetical protein